MSKELNLLIKQCRNGNQKAQLQIYDLYCDAMYTISCRYLNDEDAKDAMQQGFLKAFLNISNYSETATFGAWLKRIIINQCIDEVRKRTLSTISTEELSLEITTEEWLFEEAVSKSEIIKAINSLEEKYQIVVKLYLLEGYDHSEISEIIEIPIKTSRTRLHRGKMQLKKILAKYEKRY